MEGMKMVLLSVAVIFVGLVGSSHGKDPYAAPSPPGSVLPPPPPFKVAGLTRPGEQVTCYENSRCFKKMLQCPKECPERVPADPTAKGCFVDCGPKCEATCRTRKPNCNGFGALCYDPRFIGGDGIMFYFHGKSNENFALISDKNLQINAHFIGRRPEGRTRDYTWVQALSIMFSTHTLTVGAKKVSKWDSSMDQFFFSYDSQALSVSEGYRSSWTSENVKVERTAEANSISIIITDVIELAISVVPITEEDNRIHKYQIPSDDCFAHLEIQFKNLKLSSQVDGVLGQTYRPDFVNPVKVGVPMPIMGGEHKYRTSSLQSADCKFCIFKPTSTNSLESFAEASLDCSRRVGNGAGIVCRR